MDAVRAHCAGLESKENLDRHNGGLYYIQQVSVTLGEKGDRKAYDYLCLDLTIQSKELRKVAARAEDGDESPDDIYSHDHNPIYQQTASSPSLYKRGANLYDSNRFTPVFISPHIYRAPCPSTEDSAAML